MDDTEQLTQLNAQFIDAFRQGRWDILQPILTPGFGYRDGDSGDLWDLDRYIRELTSSPQPTIGIDQVTITVDGDVATVSARSSTQPGSFNRYLDAYQRRDNRWRCFHACVWRLN